MSARALVLLFATACTMCAEVGSSPSQGPPWFRAGGSLRTRTGSSGTGGFIDERLLLDLNVEPHSLLRFGISGHDARTRGEGDGTADSLDLTQAWAEIGTAEGPGWRLRAGRQELSLGDERLIGGDAEWSNVPLSFDALRVAYQWDSGTLSLFTARPVEVVSGTWNRTRAAEHLHGAYLSTRVSAANIDTYLFRSGCFGPATRSTAGTRMVAPLGAGFDTNLEVALQRAGGDQTALVWMGHFEIGRTFNAARPLRLAAEMNHASGDSDAVDGLTRGFNDLYAAGYNKYGTGDPFAARNLQNLELGATWGVHRRVHVAAAYRFYWAAETGDGIYTEFDEPSFFTQGKARAADHILLSAAYQPAENWSFTAGVGRIVRSNLASTTNADMPGTSVYLAVGRSF